MVPESLKLAAAHSAGESAGSINCQRCGKPRRRNTAHHCIPLFTVEPHNHSHPSGPARPPLCRFCGTVVAAKNMERHVKRLHGAQLRKAASVVVGYPCSLCNVVTPTQLVLDVHKARAHGMNDGRLRQPAVTSTILTGSATKANNTSSGDPRDATSGWSGSFRDHGQFGSHASYDAMDDDATD